MAVEGLKILRASALGGSIPPGTILTALDSFNNQAWVRSLGFASVATPCAKTMPVARF